ncbi:MAG TPA: DUF2071 domain-containing protein [Bryobacteraceae bacterium]|nr:DUF2071 domain-containing protein [Bryobacteraceae bacterium]
MLEDTSVHISEYPPRPVKWPVMLQGWDNLTFLHWRYQPDIIRRMLPRKLELDTFDGAAWIGLTPFIVTRTRPPGLPSLPWVSTFPEMNVRTYVCGPDGERGIWFFSLEADRLGAVIAARLGYGLPYRWARMAVRRDREYIEYTSRRHYREGRASIAIRIGAPIQPNEQERFLTARFRLYTRLAGRLAFAQVEHPPWPLTSATALRLEQNVIEHSGLPSPTGNPLVHFSPGVHTRIGRPTFVG